MKACSTLVLLVALAFLSRGAAADIPDPLTPLYPFGIFPSLLTDPKVVAELKLTKDQQSEIDAALKKNRNGFGIKVEPGKRLNGNEIDKANFDAMMGVLSKTLSPEQKTRMLQLIRQNAGMTLFEYKEVRDALNLKADELTKLRTLHGKLVGEYTAAGVNRSKEDQKKQFDALMKGIPPRVRAGLSEDQQKKLQELIGEQFYK